MYAMHPSRGSGGQRQGEVRQTNKFNTFEPPTPRVERAVAVHQLVECSARMWGGAKGGTLDLGWLNEYSISTHNSAYFTRAQMKQTMVSEGGS
jgi:hypothetical protein